MRYLLLILSFIAIGFSATITVNDAGDNTTNGDNKCTLREAIQSANTNSNFNDCIGSGTYGNDIIVFDPSLNGQTITLSPALSTLSITLGANNNLTIDGGSVRITISGGGSVRLFSLTGAGTLELKNLNLVAGNAGAGNGGVASLTVANQTLRLVNAFVGYNSATNGGAFHLNNTSAVLEAVNCTIAGNSATNNGGAIYLQSGTVRLSFCTIANNTTSTATSGSLHRAGGTFFVKNSIVQATGNACVGSFTGSGLNLASDTTCGASFTQSGTIDLDTLDFHGGNTRVYSLKATSSAINSVTDCTDLLGNSVAKDQRGKDRNKNNKKCDAGAFEFLANVSVSITPPGSGAVSGAGEYEKDANVSLTATPSSGYEFDKWLGDCSSCTTATCGLTVNTDKTCTAQFKTTASQQPPPLTPQPPPYQPPFDLPNQATLTTPQGAIILQSDAQINSITHSDINSAGIVPPPGYSATYGAIRFRLTTQTGFATVRFVFPRNIPQGSRVYKLVGTTLYDITSMVDIRGSTITFRIDDNSIYDANNNLGIIEDPIILLENQNPPVGGGGGCSTGAGSGLYGWLALLVLALARRLKGS